MFRNSVIFAPSQTFQSLSWRIRFTDTTSMVKHRGCSLTCQLAGLKLSLIKNARARVLVVNSAFRGRWAMNSVDLRIGESLHVKTSQLLKST